jgi:hypothetical protein
MNIPTSFPDNGVVGKWGRTKALADRTKDHKKTYGSIKGAQLRIRNYAYVSTDCTVDAEDDVRDFFNVQISCNIVYKTPSRTHIELAVITKKDFKLVNNLYENIRTTYGRKMETEIAILQKTIEASDERLVATKVLYEVQLAAFEVKLAASNHRQEMDKQMYDLRAESSEALCKSEVASLRKELEMQSKIFELEFKLAKSQNSIC